MRRIALSIRRRICQQPSCSHRSVWVDSPLVLIDPYGLTALEDAVDVGMESGMGLGRGFVHPLDTMYENSGRILQLGRDIYHGDFSRFSNVSGRDMAKFASARTGEAIGVAVACYGIAKAIPSITVGGVRFVSNVFSKGCSKNAAARFAESRTAVAVESRAVAVSEASATSGTLTEVSKKIGAPSKPIWSKTKEFSSTGNAFDHWKRHGGEFCGMQNSKQYVESAWKFRDRTDVLIKVRTNGERVLYDHTNNTFGVFTRTGVPKTMFKPIDGIKKFNEQKGVPYGN